MAIEIDLEKAYDRVRWDFVKASLNAASILSHLVKVIMNAISLSSIQVLWNGEPTQASKGYSVRLPFAAISIFSLYGMVGS